MTMRRNAARRASCPVDRRPDDGRPRQTGRVLLCAGFWLVSAASGLARAPADHPKDPPVRPLAVATLGDALQDAQQKAFFTPFTARTHIAIHAGSWDGTLAAL